MPQINPNKSYAQQALRLELAADVVIPDDWFLQLGDLVAHLLDMDNQKKAAWVLRLNQHAGANATYKFKASLLGSLQVIYSKLASSMSTADQKTAWALKVAEGADNECTPGFHNRVNEVVASFTTPKNFDELLQVQRQWIVARNASKAIEEVKGMDGAIANEIHVNNRFSMVARNSGFGVRPVNEEDIYRGNLSDDVIREKLNEAFATLYTPFHILNSLYEQIETIVREQGYAGRKEAGYEHQDYCKFDNGYLKDFVTLSFRELFYLVEEDEDGDVLMVPRVLDINWANVKNVLLKKLIDEQYFTFSPRERSLLNIMSGNHQSFDRQRREGISLFATHDELVQALIFFREWPIEKKANLVSYYLKHKEVAEKKELLKKLADIPDLSVKLQTMEAYQPIYLTMASEAGDMEKVHTLVERGADINPVLGLLFAKAKYETLWWLHQNKEVREKITEVGMQSIIPEGKYQGKAVADVFTSSKKGCQVLQEDKRLQGVCPPHIQGKPIPDYLNEKQAAIQLSQKGFFKPYVHPKVKAFLQHIILGEMKEAEKMLKDYPDMRQALLTTKAIVTDHAGRKIEGASLQLALGAKDVSPYDHEEMAEMLERYLKELPEGDAEITKQKKEQFPKGWEQQEESRQKADSAALKKVFEKIKAANTDVAAEAAVTDFKQYLARQNEGVVRTGFHFNDQLFEEACQLYDDHNTAFGGYDSKKKRMAAIKVIGGIECLFTANLAQAACDGFGNVVENKRKLSRSLKLSSPDDYQFFHPDLGVLHFVYSYYRGVAARGVVVRLVALFKTYVEQKHQTCKNLCGGSRGVKRRRDVQ